MAGGITVLRLTNSEVLQRPEESLEQIKAALPGPSPLRGRGATALDLSIFGGEGK